MVKVEEDGTIAPKKTGIRATSTTSLRTIEWTFRLGREGKISPLTVEGRH